MSFGQLLTLEALFYGNRWNLVRRERHDLSRNGLHLPDRIIGRVPVHLPPGRYFQVVELRGGTLGDFQFFFQCHARPSFS